MARIAEHLPRAPRERSRSAGAEDRDDEAVRSRRVRKQQGVRRRDCQKARGQGRSLQFSRRAKTRATVSMPLTMEEVEEGVKIAGLHHQERTETAPTKLKHWAEFLRTVTSKVACLGLARDP